MGPNEQDAFNGLLKMDATKYSTLMTDLAMGAPAPGSAPKWVDLPFLEQPGKVANADPKKEMKAEIVRLQEEKAQFSCEL